MSTQSQGSAFGLVGPAASLIGFSLAMTTSAFAGGTFYTIKVPQTPNGNFELYKLTATDGAINNSVKADFVSTSASSSITCANCFSGSTTGRVNGFSYDKSSKNVFFFDSTNTSADPTLYYAPVNGTAMGTVAGPLSGTGTGLAGINFSAAAFSNNQSAIYAIENGTSNLYRIPIAITNAGPVVSGAITNFALPGAIPGSQYGDIAINGNTLIGFTTAPSSANRLYYSYNLQTGQLGSVVSGQGVRGMQIAFSDSDGRLYGVSTVDPTNTFQDGFWYTISSSGVASSYASPTSGLGFPINDLAGVDPVPAPLPILGAAVAFRASRKMRQRIQGSRPNLTNA